jgi:hypothetical protein
MAGELQSITPIVTLGGERLSCPTLDLGDASSVAAFGEASGLLI